MKVANVEGYLTIQDQDSQIVFDPTPADGGGGGGTRPQTAPPVKEPEKGVPREIELGPLPRPPLPVTVYITKAVGLKRRVSLGDGPFLLRLDRDVADRKVKIGTIEALSTMAQLVPFSAPVAVHVYLPPNHVVDFDALKAQLFDLQERVGRPLEVRLGGELADE